MRQEEVYTELELKRIVPHSHRRAQHRGLVQRSEGWGDDEQVLRTASQRRLQHRQLGSQEGDFPMHTLWV